MQTIVLSSDVGMPFVPGMLHQWSKYGGLSTIQVAGFTPPENIGIQLSCPFISLGSFADYPASRWSDGLIRLLTTLPEDDGLILLLMEDYWLTREVNMAAIEAALELMRESPDILRACLTSDRAFGKIKRELPSRGTVDFFESAHDQYLFSLQASLWRKELMLRVLRPGESPWDSELFGTHRMCTHFDLQDLRVIGTRQWPIRYQIVMDKGKLHRDGSWMRPPRYITPEDWAELESLGLIPNIPDFDHPNPPPAKPDREEFQWTMWTS